MHSRESLSQLSLTFFVLAGILLGTALALAWLLPGWPQLVGQPSGSTYPPVFAVSTVCLVIGSWSLSRAEALVARERQRPFRQSLRRALAAGTCFVALQSYALLHFFERQTPWQAASGAVEFVAVAVALHGLHFLIAWLFLLFVVLQAQADRYDHEYYGGVTFCAWFWHVLAIVWLIVLCVMAIANQGLVDDGVTRDVAP